ncbi:MAG TPA: DsbA family protein [Thermoanaerobaculia bacterium]|nr:DsbA family protein [Thermoanaerobaculia bacterium]
MAERSSLVRLLSEYDLELDWRGFELHPETPPGGMRLDEYFPPERLRGMGESMKNFAAQHGIDDFVQRERIPNTRRALALAEVAREEGRLEEYRQRAMDAHWRDGLDIEDDEVLRNLARESGLPDDAVERSKDPKYLDRIDAIREEANAIGVEGIPTFVLGRYGFSGAQPYESFVALAERAGAKKRA